MDTRRLPVTRKRSISVQRLFDEMSKVIDLDVLAGHQGMNRPVMISDVNRPGLALGGYLDYFANDRIQILGNTETHYMERLRTSTLMTRLESMLSFEIPGFLLSRQLAARPVFLDVCNCRGIPVLRSSKSTDEVISQIILFLASEFAPQTTLHGTALDCYGVGVLLVGPPGIGKSETALELVERGHRLLSDDVVQLRRGREESLLAETDPVIEHHMEIRGVGIINIRSVFGVGRAINSMRVHMVIELEEWNESKQYDRTGLTEQHVEILGVRVPQLVIPVGAGRNMAVVIEVAALNYRLRELGEHPAERFNERLMKMMSEAVRR